MTPPTVGPPLDKRRIRAISVVIVVVLVGSFYLMRSNLLDSSFATFIEAYAAYALKLFDIWTACIIAFLLCIFFGFLRFFIAAANYFFFRIIEANHSRALTLGQGGVSEDLPLLSSFGLPPPGVPGLTAFGQMGPGEYFIRISSLPADASGSPYRHRFYPPSVVSIIFPEADSENEAVALTIDPTGEEREHGLSRNPQGSYEFDLVLGLNDPLGTYKVRLVGRQKRFEGELDLIPTAHPYGSIIGSNDIYPGDAITVGFSGYLAGQIVRLSVYRYIGGSVYRYLKDLSSLVVDKNGKAAFTFRTGVEDTAGTYLIRSEPSSLSVRGIFNLLNKSGGRADIPYSFSEVIAQAVIEDGMRIARDAQLLYPNSSHLLETRFTDSALLDAVQWLEATRSRGEVDLSTISGNIEIISFQERYQDSVHLVVVNTREVWSIHIEGTDGAVIESHPSIVRRQYILREWGVSSTHGIWSIYQTDSWERREADNEAELHT